MFSLSSVVFEILKPTIDTERSMVVSNQQVTNTEFEPWRDLRGKIVMVTGASSGLGWEICIDLAKVGCKIIAVARRIERLKTLCDKINNLDVNYSRDNQSQATNNDVLAVAMEIDICADSLTIETSVRKAWEAFGRIDALINNAGITGPLRSSLDLEEEDWDRIFRTNTRGSWLVSKYVCLQMIAFNQGGSIINISSLAGANRVHSEGMVAYASSKSAFNTMTKAIAMELGKHKIRVNGICPGIFKSEITEALMQKKWLKNVASKVVPLRDLGTSDPALTSLAMFLVHDSSNYMTGNIFIVDVGFSLPGVPLYSSL